MREQEKMSTPFQVTDQLVHFQISLQDTETGKIRFLWRAGRRIVVEGFEDFIFCAHGVSHTLEGFNHYETPQVSVPLEISEALSGVSFSGVLASNYENAGESIANILQGATPKDLWRAVIDTIAKRVEQPPCM
jgi:hypothetical protein